MRLGTSLRLAPFRGIWQVREHLDDHPHRHDLRIADCVGRLDAIGLKVFDSLFHGRLGAREREERFARHETT